MSKTKKIISVILTVALIMTMATVAIVSTSAASKVYFEDSLNWGNIYAYCYGGSAGEELGSWPGTACNAEGNGIWSIELNGSPDAIIFHANDDANQTSNIAFAGDNMIAKLTGEWIQGDYKMVAVAEFEAYGEGGNTDTPATDAPATDAPVVDTPVVDGETITVYFTNNWCFTTQNVYYWGTNADPEWPGVAMTFVETNEEAQDVYCAEIPANATGIIFNGEHDQQPGTIRQTVDITSFANNSGFYCVEEIDGKITVDTYTWDKNTTDTPATDAPATDAPATDAPATDAPATDAPVDEPTTETGIVVDGVVYDKAVDSTVTYTVDLTAARLFENIQAVVSYDSTKLELVRIKSDDPDVADWEVEGPARCPNLDGVIFNAGGAGVVKFNASKVAGYNFKEAKTLITLEFVVKSTDRNAIDLVIEEMTIKGDGTESYFTGGQAVITDGITVVETLTGGADIEDPTTDAPTTEEPSTDAPVVVPETGIVVGGVVYNKEVGSTVTYTVDLTAARLFENIQAVVSYDSTALELVRIKSDDPDVADWEVEGPERCPNLDGVIFNAGAEGVVKFNASKVAGYNFKDGKVLVTLEFVVKSTAKNTIDLVIEEMTIKGDGTESYFTGGQAVITEGITIVETLTGGVDITEAPTTDAPTTEAPTNKPTDKPTDKPTNAPVVDPTEGPTSSTGTADEADPNAPETGAAAYIIVAIALMAMVAGAVVVLRKKAND